MTERRFELPGAIGDSPIRGIMQLPPGVGAHAYALLIHGYTSFCQWGFWPELARRLAAQGIASLRFNFSGDGIGEDLRHVVDFDAVARSTYVAELDDLETIRAWADLQPELDSDHASIVGHSRGGGMGIIHAAERGGYRQVIGWAPLPEILRFSGGRLEQWRRDSGIEVLHHTLGKLVHLELSVLESAEQNRERLDIAAACARLQCPLLVFSGARDRGLRVREGEHLVEQSLYSASRHVIIPAAGHVFGAREPLADIPPRLESLLTQTVDALVPSSHVTP